MTVDVDGDAAWWTTAVDFLRVTAWMDERGLGRGPAAHIELLGGGTQNLLLRFVRGGRTYVLRRPPRALRPTSNETMRREMRVLKALAGTGVPHPTLIASCPDTSIIGTAFYLMEAVDGFNATLGLPALHKSSEAVRRRMGLSMVEGIVALGSIDHEAVGLTGFGRPENYLERQVARWNSQLESYREFAEWPGPGELPGIATIAAWLNKYRPAGFAAGIMHGDYHLSNVLFQHDGPEVAAIIDWELATIGDPLLDLGWLLATWAEEDPPPEGSIGRVVPWTGFPTSGELIEHYREHSRRDLTATQWYTVMACFKLGIIIEGTYARACAGKAPVETGDRLHRNAIASFTRALRWIG